MNRRGRFVPSLFLNNFLTETLWNDIINMLEDENTENYTDYDAEIAITKSRVKFAARGHKQCL